MNQNKYLPSYGGHSPVNDGKPSKVTRFLVVNFLSGYSFVIGMVYIYFTMPKDSGLGGLVFMFLLFLFVFVVFVVSTMIMATVHDTRQFRVAIVYLITIITLLPATLGTMNVLSSQKDARQKKVARANNIYPGLQYVDHF